MRTEAYAKINLSLEVGARDPASGYHFVTTVLQAVTLSDTVEVLPAPAGAEEDSLTVTGADLPLDRTNLARRAAEAYRTIPGASRAPVRIRLVKRIPSGAGLGGGSADAAAVLRLMRGLFGDPVSDSALYAAAETLGADVPFCLAAGLGIPACLGTRYGEKLTAVPAMPDCAVVIARKGDPVSTPEAYRLVDALPPVPAENVSRNVGDALTAGDYAALCRAVSNRFEAAVIPVRPEIAGMLRLLRENGADAARMSGSGSAVYGFFSDAGAAERAVLSVRNAGGSAFPCRPLRC